MSSHSVRRLVAAASVAMLAGGFASVTASPAYAATTCTSGVPGDVNGDGYAEVAIGAPGEEGLGRGAVHLLYGSKRGLVVKHTGSALDDQLLTPDALDLPEPGARDDGFGGVTAFGDFNHDGCADLAVSSFTSDLESVTVFPGSPKGLRTTGLLRLTPEVLWPDDDGDLSPLFGRSLAVADLNGDGIEDLAVAAPFLARSNKSQAGGVAVYFGSSTGLNGGQQPVAVSQDTPGVPGTSEVYDQFGLGLAAGDFDGKGHAELAVGSFEPSVQVLRFDSSGLAGTQSDPIRGGKGSVLSEGTRYPIDLGGVLAAGDVNGDGIDDLAASAALRPDSGVGFDEGVVFLLRGSSAGLTTTGHQTITAAIRPPGVNEESEFASTMAMARLDTGSTDDLVIGTPDDPVSGRFRAGNATVIFGSSSGLATNRVRVFHQNVRGIAGTAQVNDEFGAAVTAAYVRGAKQATLLVGVADEKVSGKRSAGRVHELGMQASGPRAKGSHVFQANTPGLKGPMVKDGAFGKSVGPDVAPFR